MPHGEHDHQHDHGHPPARYDTAFAIGVSLNLALVIGQVVFGLLAGSLALIADAGHNLGDVLGLVLAWVAAVLGRRPPTERRTYGFGRSSILAALANAVVLLIGVGAIVLEAIRRLLSPAPVAGLTVMWVALAAILVNGSTAYLFMRGRGQRREHPRRLPAHGERRARLLRRGGRGAADPFHRLDLARPGDQPRHSRPSSPWGPGTC